LIDAAAAGLSEGDFVWEIEGRGEFVRIHVGNADLVPKLIAYFAQQSDCVVQRVSATEIDVALLGSYRNDRHDRAVERLLADFWLNGSEPLGPRAANGH
jgi:hypothetical protein